MIHGILQIADIIQRPLNPYRSLISTKRLTNYFGREKTREVMYAEKNNNRKATVSENN